ncbi:zf-TFIIB domain-containing protein [Spirillospora sp. NPDC127200]
MTCPSCSGRGYLTREDDGLDVDVCPTCHGTTQIPDLPEEE